MQEDKTYWEALMEAPARADADLSAQEGFAQTMRAISEFQQALVQLFQEVADTLHRVITEPIVHWWNSPQTRRFFRTVASCLRSVGIRPARRRERSKRRMLVYQKKMQLALQP